MTYNITIVTVKDSFQINSLTFTEVSQIMQELKSKPYVTFAYEHKKITIFVAHIVSIEQTEN